MDVSEITFLGVLPGTGDAHLCSLACRKLGALLQLWAAGGLLLHSSTSILSLCIHPGEGAAPLLKKRCGRPVWWWRHGCLLQLNVPSRLQMLGDVGAGVEVAAGVDMQSWFSRGLGSSVMVAEELGRKPAGSAGLSAH